MIQQSRVIGGNNGNRRIQKYQHRLYAENRGIRNQEQGIIALDDPESVDKNNLRYDVGLIVTGNVNMGLDVREIPDGMYAVFEIPHTAEAVSEFWNNLSSLLGKLPIDWSKPIVERYNSTKISNHLCEFCIPLK